MTPIAIVDFDCKLPTDLLTDFAEAATIFATRDAGQASPLGWGTPAMVRLAPSVDDVQPGEWLCGLWSHPDVPGALGYHDKTVHGKPLMHCFPLLDSLDNTCITITHEIVEALADPLICRASVGSDGVVRALEPGDPVEATSYAIKVSSGRDVLVTNFVTPAYFEPPADLTGVKLDFLGLVSTPGQILTGGYQICLRNGVWSMTQSGHLRPYRAAIKHVGRGAVRSRKLSIGLAHAKRPLPL